LTYPADFSPVTLIYLSGQIGGNFDLPPIGKFSMPKAHISKGIYFLKFDGKGTETVKVNR